jgi:predicted nucleotidyltransferase component of viral defense system
VIPVGEVRALQTEWRLRDDVIEKDYVLGWLLAAIAAVPTLRSTWIFKGGTALRKCYFETYRFSEDLDFTIIDGGPMAPDDLVLLFREIASWLLNECGLEIVVDPASFKQRRNRRGKATTEGKLAFRGPRNPPSLPKVKLDLTSDEVVPTTPVDRPITHPYSDGTGWSTVRCYSIVDLLAEKLRALAERCRPRDLYDIVHLHRHADLVSRASEVAASLNQKCTHAGIDVPTHATVQASPFRNEVETEWSNMLAHQLPHLPPFADFWGALGGVFDWLQAPAAVSTSPMRRAELGRNLDATWMPPRGMATWGGRASLELIRFAGANRLKVQVDYRAEDGRVGPRIVEPYSLRRTHDGNLLLFVVNDVGQLRSYRVDRIVGATVTSEPFVPRYFVEF